MASIKMSKNHSLPKDQVKNKVDSIIGGYVQRFGLKKEWQGDDLKVKGSGIDGTLRVTDNSVDVDLGVGLMARPFQGRIEQGLKDELEKALKG